MPLVSDTIQSLLGGVSQAAPRLRAPSTASDQVNAYSHLTRGLRKRPPSEFVAKLTGDTAGYDDALVDTLVRGDDERYRIVVVDGDLKVFDYATGEEKTVNFPKGKGYLNGTDGFRAVMVGDTTWVVNRGVATAASDTTQPVPIPGALVYVRQGEFSTTYSLYLNGAPLASYTTVDGTSPKAQTQIDTTVIASKLKEKLDIYDDFTVEQFGSTLYINRVDNADFRILAEDGLADRGLVVVKGSVQRFEDLPLRAKDGFTVEVTGDPGSVKDNFWVQYDDRGSPDKDGVWREIPKPGSHTSFDSATMPHQLIFGGAFEGPEKAVQKADVPQVIETGWEYIKDGWDYDPGDPHDPGDPNSPPPIEPEDDQRLGGHRDRRRRTFQSSRPGARTLEARYDIDTSKVPTGTQVDVVMRKNGVEVDRKSYPAGRVFPDEALSSTNETINQNDELEVEVLYSTGKDEADKYTQAVVNLRGSDRDGIVDYIPTTRTVVFREDARYPQGCSVTVTVEATPFTHTPASEETGLQVASALRALIDADASFAASIDEPGKIEIDYVGQDLPPGVAVTVGWDPAKNAYLPDFSMTTDEHAGRILKNLTDGSEGVIASNTGTTVTLNASGLSGGFDNKIEAGDVCTIVGTGTYFTFRPAPWKKRQAGTLDTVPFPSILGEKVDEVFFIEGRLGLAAGDNIVLSQAGDPLNLFRQTARDLLADDVIDIESAGQRIASFHTALPWNESLYLWSDTGQWELSGEPVLTPSTVRLDAAAEYPNDADCRPVAAGTSVFFARAHTRGVHVMEAQVEQYTGRVVAEPITNHVPTYIEGNPLKLAVDPTAGVLAIMTDAGNRDTLYVFCYRDTGRERLLASWSKWELPSGTLIGLDASDGKLSLVCKADDGVYLEEIELNVEEAPASEEKSLYLDRKVENGDVGMTYSNPNTTVTLPYGVPVGSRGTFRVLQKSDGAALTPSWLSDTQFTLPGNLLATELVMGHGYEFRFEFSPVFMRDPETRRPYPSGRLNLRYGSLHFHDSTDFTLTVTPQGRTPYTYTHTSDTPEEGTVRFPIQARAEDTKLVLTNDTPGGCAFSTLDWEGLFYSRSKRI